MGLTFPNPSRNYDTKNHLVRFVGHDGMFQISFSIEAAALSGRGSDPLRTEAEFLNAFDAARKLIQDLASKAYARTRKSSYALTAADI